MRRERLEGKAHSSLRLGCRTLLGQLLITCQNAFVWEQEEKGHLHGGMFRDKNIWKIKDFTKSLPQKYQWKIHFLIFLSLALTLPVCQLLISLCSPLPPLLCFSSLIMIKSKET